MKLYFAGAEKLVLLKNLIENGARNVLFSYYYLYEAGIKNIKYWLASERIDYTKLDIYLDCGAYTAWTKGVKIDLQQYMNFIKVNQEVLTAYSALDDKNSADNTKNNLKIMEENGLKPVAVYHLTMNDWNYLEELCSTHPYIALGAIAGENKDYNVVQRNINKAIEIAKKHKTRLHVYGFMIYNYLARNPIYSCDATTWLEGGKRGTVFLADHNRYSLTGISYHDKTLFKYKDKLEEMGFNYNDMIQDKNWKLRDAVNIKTLIEVNNKLNEIYEQNKMAYWEEPNKNSTSPNKFEEYKGQIQEILKDPEIEKKRKEKQREWARLGLANLKHGKYATFPFLFPDKDYALSSVGEDLYDPKEYYKNILESIKDIDIRQNDKLLEVLNEMIRIDLIRIAKNLIYEAADGGIQDRNLSTLINNVSSRILTLLALKKQNIPVNNFIFQAAEEIKNNFDESTRAQFIELLQRSIKEDSVRE